jgi:hypothetical protein
MSAADSISLIEPALPPGLIPLSEEQSSNKRGSSHFDSRMPH